ncbi:MAG: Stp1/IreP family PP2C-type Ser/Thr phosphatase [Myxococcales bacterium]
MRVEAAGRTDVGLRREHNEDALLVLPEFGLAVVCDGLGGHQAGEVASAMAVETVRMFFERTADPEATWPYAYDESRDEPTNLLEVAVQWANRRIRDLAETDATGKQGMATTFVGVLMREASAHFAWVGDSRGYLFRKGQLLPATTDHSLVNELLKAGQLSEEDVPDFQHRNVITRALGMDDVVAVDFNAVQLQPGDVCLVCCDGLTGMVTDERIAQIIAAEPDLDRACEALVAEANKNGGIDNITVALLRRPPAPG